MQKRTENPETDGHWVNTLYAAVGEMKKNNLIGPDDYDLAMDLSDHVAGRYGKFKEALASFFAMAPRCGGSDRLCAQIKGLYERLFSEHILDDDVAAILKTERSRTSQKVQCVADSSTFGGREERPTEVDPINVGLHESQRVDGEKSQSGTFERHEVRSVSYPDLVKSVKK